MTTSEATIKAEYYKFLAMFGKAYASVDQHDHRFAIFKDNFTKIEEHNNSVDELGRSPPFTMGINQFSDMTAEEFSAEKFGGVRIPNRLKSKTSHKRL